MLLLLVLMMMMATMTMMVMANRWLTDVVQMLFLWTNFVDNFKTNCGVVAQQPARSTQNQTFGILLKL